MIAAAPFASQLGRLTGIGDGTLVIFALAMMAADGITVIPLALIMLRVESSYYVVVTAAMFCCRITLTILTVVGFGWGIWGILGSSTATAVIFGWSCRGELMKYSFRPDVKRLGEILCFAAPWCPPDSAAWLCTMETVFS